jgi:hypothetical protein
MPRNTDRYGNRDNNSYGEGSWRNDRSQSNDWRDHNNERGGSYQGSTSGQYRSSEGSREGSGYGSSDWPGRSRYQEEGYGSGYGRGGYSDERSSRRPEETSYGYGNRRDESSDSRNDGRESYRGGDYGNEGRSSSRYGGWSSNSASRDPDGYGRYDSDESRSGYESGRNDRGGESRSMGEHSYDDDASIRSRYGSSSMSGQQGPSSRDRYESGWEGTGYAGSRTGNRGSSYGGTSSGNTYGGRSTSYEDEPYRGSGSYEDRRYGSSGSGRRSNDSSR